MGRRRAAERGWSAAATALTVAGAGLLLIVLTGELDSWMGVLAAVLISAGAACTVVGLIVGAVQSRRQAGGPR